MPECPENMPSKIKSGWVAAIVLVAAALAVGGQGQKAASEYAGLRDQVKSGDFSVDFQRLRMSYVDSPEFKKARDTDEQRTQMIQAVNAKDYKLAIKNADVVLENNYADMDAHFGKYIAHRELGDAKQAEFHRHVFDGLIKSVLNSGDGKSIETAYVVVSVHEEYVVLQVLGLQPQGQSLLHDQGHSYDVMKAKDRKSGEAVTLYFNADIPFKSYLLDKK